MKSLDALNILADLSASQRGLFTTAQAHAVGVDRLTLSRLAKNGHIERIVSGVYRASAAPSFREERAFAVWLALEPTTPAWERPRDAGGLVASHGTAAWLLGLGELNPEPFTFTSARRRQTRRRGVRLVKAVLDGADVTDDAGIPVTTPERTILDLLRDGEDLSLIGSVLRDALVVDSSVATDEFKTRIDAFAARRGYPKACQLYDLLVRG